MHRQLAARVLGLVVCLAGCGVADLGKSIENTGKDISDAAAKLAKLKEIDPLGYNRILSQNDALRKELDDARVLLAGAVGSPFVVLKGNRVQLKIWGGIGAVVVDSWIGDTTNMVTYRKVVTDSTYRTIAFDWPAMFKQACTAAYALPVQVPGIGQVDCSRHGSASDLTDAIDRSSAKLGSMVNDSVNTRWWQYAASSGLPRVEADISEQFLEYGDRQIFIRVTPIATNGLGDWAIHGDIEITPTSGPARILKPFTIERRDHQNLQLNQAVTAYRALLRVEAQ